MLADCKPPHPPPWQSKGIALIKKNNHHIHCQVKKKKKERHLQRVFILSFIYLFFKDLISFPGALVEDFHYLDEEE